MISLRSSSNITIYTQALRRISSSSNSDGINSDLDENEDHLGSSFKALSILDEHERQRSSPSTSQQRGSNSHKRDDRRRSVSTVRGDDEFTRQENELI